MNLLLFALCNMMLFFVYEQNPMKTCWVFLVILRSQGPLCWGKDEGFSTKQEDCCCAAKKCRSVSFYLFFTCSRPTYCKQIMIIDTIYIMPCNLVLSRHVCMYVLYVDTVQGPHRENLSFYTSTSTTHSCYVVAYCVFFIPGKWKRQNRRVSKSI